MTDKKRDSKMGNLSYLPKTYEQHRADIDKVTGRTEYEVLSAELLNLKSKLNTLDAIYYDYMELTKSESVGGVRHIKLTNLALSAQSKYISLYKIYKDLKSEQFNSKFYKSMK